MLEIQPGYDAMAQMLKSEARRKELGKAFGDVSAFIGITAVHGLEPFLIVVEAARKVNDELSRNGLDRKPVILPFVEGHSAYGQRLKDVLSDEYDQEVLNDIYFSGELGSILIRTQFDQSGYQPHLESVSSNQASAQDALWRFMDQPIKATSFSGEQITLAQDKRIIEINAGANVTAAKNGDKTTHFIFPVTFDGLLRLIQEHNEDVFDYNPDLVRECLKIASKLKGRYRTTLIPDLHTLLEEPELIDELYDGVTYIPPLKEPQKPPSDITFDFNNNQIIDSRGGKKRIVPFNPEKGAVYMNISGGGMGLDAAISAAQVFNRQGYAVFMPSWMIKDATGFAIGSAPSILFAKDPNGGAVFKAILMRPGKGITDRAQLSEIPMLSIPYFRLDNPEIWGNINAIINNRLGREFSSRRDILDLLKGYDRNIHTFNEAIYKSQNIPRDVSGSEYAAQKIIQAEIEASKSR